MLRVLLIALLATFLLSDAASAQTQRRGRFFQRVKQDIFGIKPATPTPSKSGSQKSPTPSQNKSTDYKKTPQRNQALPSRGITNNFSSPKKYTGPPRKGFGFEVIENNSDQLVVGRIVPQGNGAEAGLKRGDQVIEIGGIEATSVKEYEEIAKIMQDGDQMEFKIKRNGLEKPMMITYGNPPQIDGEKESSPVAKSSNKNRRYDFAPPKSQTTSNQQFNRGDNSILDTPAPGARNQVVNSPTNITRKGIGNTAGNNTIVVQQLRDVIERQNMQIRRLQTELANLKRFGR